MIQVAVMFQVLAAYGWKPTGGAEISADGRLHHVALEGDEKGVHSGWYVCSSWPLTIAFGDLRSGISHRWVCGPSDLPDGVSREQ